MNLLTKYGIMASQITDPNTYFYNLGVETVPWSQAYSGGAGTKTYTENADHIYLYGANGIMDGSPTSAIDLTNLTTLYIDWEGTGRTNAGSSAGLLMKTDRTTMSSFTVYAEEVGIFTRKTSSVNVSALNGMYYPTVRANGGNSATYKSELKVYKVWGL